MKRVVIVGGGMAGLASAKVLSRHFEEVILIKGHEPSQSHHLHVLLKSGQLSLERIFPKISEKFEEAKCPFIDWAKDTLWENGNHQFPQYGSPIKTYSMGRFFLNRLMMNELTRLENVIMVDDKAIDFTFNNKAFVKTCKGQVFETDHVVLATGEQFPLKKVGRILKEKTCEINLTYRSLLFRTKDLKMNNIEQYYYQLDPPYSYLGCVISPIENGTSLVTLIESEAIFTKCTTVEDFFNKTKRVPGGKVYSMIKEAHPLSVVSTYRKNKMSKRIFDLKALPKQLILVGDLHASLNPIFGQGMSLTLLQIELLKQKMGPNFSSLKFHQEVQKLISYPFFLSHVGSLPQGPLKNGLRLFLKGCQKSPILHQFFLTHLHSLGNKKRLL